MAGSCSITGCTREARARGWCPAHYQRWRKLGDPLACKRGSVEERYWAKVLKAGPDDCWLWTGCSHKSGHGEFYVSPQRGTCPAHAFALELATGLPCPPGKETCHHCDNPPCQNPRHLYYGTRQQNVDDAVERGRNARGARHGSSLLSEDDIVEIRVRYARGEASTALAATFGVRDSTISLIAHGDRWQHVGGPRSPRSHGRRPDALRRALADG